mgnify:FL=1
MKESIYYVRIKKNNFFLLNGYSFLDIDLIKFYNFNHKKALCTICLTKNINYKENKKLNNLKIDKNGYVYYSNSKRSLMNGGIYFFNKSFLKYLVNKKISLENDILHKLILENKIKGYYTKNKFIDIGTLKNLNYLKKNFNYFKFKKINYDNFENTF